MGQKCRRRGVRRKAQKHHGGRRRATWGKGSLVPGALWWSSGLNLILSQPHRKAARNSVKKKNKVSALLAPKGKLKPREYAHLPKVTQPVGLTAGARSQALPLNTYFVMSSGAR